MRYGVLAGVAAFASLAAACLGHGDGSASAQIAITLDGRAIVNATRVSFEGLTQNFEGEPTYRWDFGDGGTALGRVAEHVYQTEGRFQVTLSAENTPRLATARRDVEVRSLSGRWDSRDQSGPIGAGFQFELTQSSGTLKGRVLLFSSCPLPPPGGTIEGTVSHPREVRWILTCQGASPWVGEVNPSLDAITVRREGSSPADPPRTYYRP